MRALEKQMTKTTVLTTVILSSILLTGGLVLPVAFAENNGRNGTTLSAEKTANGEWVRIIQWDITKTVTPELHELDLGESASSEYTVSVDNTGYNDVYKVSGEICVTNGGEVSTENLKLVDQVQYKNGKGKFQDLPGATLTITPEQLEPGETACYPYEIEFTPIDGAKYRNTVLVTITNHSGSLGDEKGPNPKAGFTIPDQPVLENEEIHVSDTNGENWGPVSDDASWTYDVEFTCGTTQTYGNTATIDETGQEANASVEVRCNIPPTEISLGDFRTQTQGGWGTECNGNNPGCYREVNFGSVFSGGLVIGHSDGFTAIFTSSSAIAAFLPQGGTPGVLDDNDVDPTSTSAEVFGGQVTALSLSVGFDLYDPGFGVSTTNLNELVVVDAGSACYDMTVQDVLYTANLVLSGDTNTVFSASDLNDCVSSINENFVDGTQNNGFLGLP